MQTVREQAAAAEASRGVKVVAAVNADFYNMGTGQPSGVLVMNGKQVNNPAGRNYFAILEDGSAVIRTGNLRNDEIEAVGGDVWFVHEGKAVEGSGDYYTTKQPRTAVGIKADGTVVIVVADGRRAPYSSGYTLNELSAKMIELGCVEALNLDGGGSTTYLAKYSGKDELELANMPADGQERSVSSSLMVVSNAVPTGNFASAEITPNNEVYTPGSTIEFTAIGADTAGFAAAVPEEAQWRLAAGYENMGTITDVPAETEGQKVASFVAAEGATGTAVVELIYNGEVFGSASVELQWPDTLTMENSQFSLDFSEETDFGIAAQWKTRDVHLKPGDLVWEIGSTGNEEFPSVGQMNGDIFVADAEATNVTATVTAKLAHDINITVSAEVSVGQLPYVFMDFEDIVNDDGTITAAEDYYTFGNGGNFLITTTNKGETGSAKIVDISNGEVRMGQKALQLNYDFSNATREATLGVYFGTSSYVRVPQMGMPTAIGVWIYVPSDGFNFWLRTWFKGYDENGNAVGGNSFAGGFGANFNENDGISLDKGWNYITADLTQANSFGPAYYEFGNQIFRMMLVGPSGTYSSGHIYLDNFQLEYGTNTDDIFAPEINSVNLNSESGASLEDGMTISDDPFSIYASYEEFTGLSDEELAEIEDEEERERYEKASLYATGVNTQNVHVYVDGNEVNLNNATETYLATSSISLTNGEHNITIEVADNFQNITTRSYTVYVSNDKEYSKVYLQPQEEAPYLGSAYKLELIADIPEMVKTVTFEIRLGAGLSLADCTNIAPGFNVTECALIHVNNNIFRVTLERVEGDETEYIGATTLAEININCPATLAEGSKLSYWVESSEVIYTDEEFQGEVINSFYDENEGEDILSYYTIEADLMIVGSAEEYYIHVTTPDGTPAEGVTVTIDGADIGTTDSEGKIEVGDYFVGAAVTKVVAAYSENGYSYGQRISSVLPGGTADSAAPLYVRTVATENGNTEQRIVWLSNPLFASDTPLVRFATKAEYEAAGSTADALTNEVAGTNILLEFTGTYAVNVNQVLITGLKEDTEYVYIAGDGETWSAVQTFATAKKNASTNFFIIGDTQENNPEAINAYGNAITNSGIDYDFAIQTGDFVDNGGNYTLWNNILAMFAPYFSETDFVQVFGNHEYEGSTEGIYPEAMNFVPDKDYYSVTYGNVYVAVINIYTADGLKEAIEWIKEDAAKSDAIWKVLTMHRPPYYTNISGGSETAHEMIPALVDEAGFDVVFSGHDHAFARTEPMTGGVVDKENGAVYYIVGAAESGRYGVYDNPEYNFVKATGDFNAIYLSVSASYTKMEITAYNMLDDGSFVIFDSYTITNDCYPDNHEYVYNTATGMLLCQNCYYEVAPEEISFSGLITDTEGRLMYFVNGEMHTGWMTIGEDTYYFGEDGLGVNGTVTFQESHCYDNYASGDIDYYFENGLMVGGYTGKYGVRYFVNGVMYEGWIELEDGYYYFTTTNDFGLNGVRRGDRATGIATVYTNTQPYNTLYKVTLDETGKFIGGYFHYRDYNGLTSFTDVRNPHSEDGIWIVYRTNEWVDYNGNLYYANGSGNLVKGLYAVDGVMYEFDDSEGSPAETNSCKLIGKYTGWNGEKYYVEGIEQSGWTIIDGDYYYFATAEEVDFAPDAGFEVGDRLTGNAAVYSPTQPYGTFYYINFAEDGKYISGDWHKRSNGGYARTQVAPPTDDSNIWISYINGAFEVDGKEYYAVNGIIVTGDYVIDGVKFKFSTEGTSPEEGLGAKLGRYYTITFICDEEVSEIFELYQQSLIVPPEYVKPVDSTMVAAYDFLGWYNSEEMFEDGMVASANVTYTAKYQKVHAALYYDIAEVLAALEETAESGTPADKHDAVDDVTKLYETLTAENIADAEDEGLSFELYEQMLGKLYEVSFISNGITITSKTLYEGEAVNAPMFDPIKASSSSMVASYAFEGWYNGEVKWTSGVTATADATYTAAFSKVYSTTYNTLKTLTDALAAAQTPTEKHIAVSNLRTVYATLTEKDKTDAEAEGLSFAQYEEMLGKLYEVTFAANGKTVSVTEYYEGEAIAAPAAPEKSGNRVKSYEFDGWYNGEDVLAEGATATSDALYEAKYTMVYTEKFTALKEALEALAEVGADGSLEAQYEALSAVYTLYEEFGSAELRDAVAEGLSFEQYEEMLEAYNGAAQGAEEDLAVARILANRFADAAAAVIALASAAYVTLGRRW